MAADQRALATFLLRFFIPQVLFYALGTVSTAVLQSRGRFALTAIAPDREHRRARRLDGRVPLHGRAATRASHLSRASGWSSRSAAPSGVVAFVGVTVVGVWTERLPVSLRGAPRRARRATSAGLLRLSGWAAVQHSGGGVLLGGAIVAAGGLAGGVVAYQLAMVVFLAPYGILAQPIHTAVLPRLVAEVAAGDLAGMRSTAPLGGRLDGARSPLPVAALLGRRCAPR